MKTSKNGIELIKKFEGNGGLKVYICPAGKKTVGYGHTGADVNAMAVGTKITMAQAEKYLQTDLARFEKKVMSYDVMYHWKQNEFDSLVSFAYNLGEGKIDSLTDHGKRSRSDIAKKMLEYDKARVNGVLQPLSGLTKRRKAEHDMFLGATSEPRNLRKGDKGEDVKVLQRALIDLGYLAKGKDTGNFLSLTDEAVRGLQADRGLQVDGVVGPATRKSLGI